MIKGYKETEIGKIPEDWQVVKLEEVLSINPSKTTGLSESFKVSFVGMADVSADAKLICHHPRNYKEVAKGFTSFIDGDVLVAKITPCFENGKGALVTGLTNGIGFGSTEFHVLRANDKSCISNKFIYYHTISHPFREVGKGNMTGSAGQKRVPKEFISRYTILLPPLPEQQKIAEILSTVDAKIEVIEERIEQTQELKKGLMQRLLTRGIGHTQFKDSPLGEIPASWEVKKVNDFILNKKGAMKIGPFGSQLKKDLFVVEGYKVYGQENIFEKDLNYGDRFITKDHFNRLKSCELLPGDFIISMMGTIGKCLVVPEGISRGIMDSHLLRLQLDSCKIASVFLNQLFNSPIVLLQVDKLAVGGIMAGLSSSIVNQINFPIPTLSEQYEIAKILSSVDEKLEVLRDKKSQYQELKRGLMQQLLTGKLRVNHLIAEEAML